VEEGIKVRFTKLLAEGAVAYNAQKNAYVWKTGSALGKVVSFALPSTVYTGVGYVAKAEIDLEASRRKVLASLHAINEFKETVELMSGEKPMSEREKVETISKLVEWRETYLAADYPKEMIGELNRLIIWAMGIDTGNEQLRALLKEQVQVLGGVKISSSASSDLTVGAELSPIRQITQEDAGKLLVLMKRTKALYEKLGYPPAAIQIFEEQIRALEQGSAKPKGT
jgi:hypothetical protein